MAVTSNILSNLPTEVETFLTNQFRFVLIEILAASFLLFTLSQSIVVKAADANICNGRDGIFIKNPRGCEYFFYCHEGLPLEAYCPGTFWFNEDSGICEDRKNVICEQPKPPVTPPVDLDEPVRCPATDTNSITFIASGIDCNRYYICYHGNPIRQQCIPDMHWNAAIKKCDYPNDAKCEVETILLILFRFYFI